MKVRMRHPARLRTDATARAAALPLAARYIIVKHVIVTTDNNIVRYIII